MKSSSKLRVILFLTLLVTMLISCVDPDPSSLSTLGSTVAPTPTPTPEPTPKPTATPTLTPNYKVVGFIGSWAMSHVWSSGTTLESDPALDKLTHIIYSAIRITSSTDPILIDRSSTLDPNDPYCTLANVVKAAHKKGIPVLASLASGDQGSLDSIVPSDTLRPILVDNIKNLVTTFNLDGIDIDWESDESQEIMDQLIADIYSVLHPLGKIITVDVDWNETYDLSLSAASQYVDMIMVMCYDFWNFPDMPSPAYHSTYEDTVKVMTWWINGGYPREKLVMGIPFYGRDASAKPYNYSDIVDVLNPTPDQDLAYIDTFLGQPVSGGYIWWNGINTVKQKIDWAVANGLGGVMLQDVGRDKLNDSRSLLGAIYAELNVTSQTPPTVTSNTASNVTTNGATLNGNLTNKGSASSIAVSFEYGLTGSYGSMVAGVPATLSAPGVFTASITSLSPNTLYHYRAKVVGDSTVYGSDQTFTTLSANHAPVLKTIGNKTVKEGATLTFTVLATDTDGDALTYSASNLPVGATFNAPHWIRQDVNADGVIDIQDAILLGNHFS